MNPYAVLGLLPSADIDAVRRRYRTIARELHPDVAGPDATAAMAEVNEAYAILTDPERRERLNWNPANDPWLDFLSGYFRDRRPGVYRSYWASTRARGATSAASSCTTSVGGWAPAAPTRCTARTRADRRPTVRAGSRRSDSIRGIANSRNALRL
jgi:curved DNA-binding protein CbpA